MVRRTAYLFMNKKRIITASDVALDALLAKAIGINDYVLSMDESRHVYGCVNGVPFSPSSDWRFVGRVIQEHKISLGFEGVSDYSSTEFWFAGIVKDGSWDYYAESKIDPKEAILRSFLLYKEAQKCELLSAEVNESVCPTETEPNSTN